jgi:hypothetical protein
MFTQWSSFGFLYGVVKCTFISEEITASLFRVSKLVLVNANVHEHYQTNSVILKMAVVPFSETSKHLTATQFRKLKYNYHIINKHRENLKTYFFIFNFLRWCIYINYIINNKSLTLNLYLY